MQSAEAMRKGAVETAGLAVIDVLGHGALFEPRAAQPAGGLAVVPLGRLAIDQQSQTFLEAQGVEFRGLGLLRQCLGHAGQTQLGQTLIGWMIEHGGACQW